MLFNQLKNSFQRITDYVSSLPSGDEKLEELLRAYKSQLQNHTENEFNFNEDQWEWSWNCVANEFLCRTEVHKNVHQPMDVTNILQRVLSFASNSDKDKLQSTLEAVLAKGNTQYTTLQVQKNDTEVSVINLVIEPTVEEGKLFSLKGTIVPSNIVNALTKKFEQRESIYETLMNSANELVCLYHPNGEYKYVSDSVSQITGYSKQEILGTKFWVYLHPDDTDRIREKAKSMFEKGATYTEYHRLKKKTGEYIWLHTIAKTVENKATGELEILTSSRDFTESKIAQRKLEQEEAKFKGLLESAPDAMVIVDDKGKVVLVNAQTEKLFGYAKEELLGNKVEMLIPKRYNERHKKHRSGYTHQPKTRGMGEGRELFGLRKDGTEFPVEISLSPIKTAEGLMISSAIRDITERVEIQNKLKLARTIAEENVRLKQNFLANMSHEIRTPMNAILGFTKFLLKTELSQEQLDYTKTIDNSVEDLLLIINDILDFSRLEAGKVILESVAFSLKDKMTQWAKLYKIKAEEKGLHFHFHWDNALPNTVLGDSLRLGQMISNLLSNAIKFTSKGSVTLSVQLLSEQNENCSIEIVVLDTGIGIDEFKKKIIFESFRQAQSNTTREYGGTGLGLSIVSDLVDLHQGKIQVSSKLNSGSKFTLELNYKVAKNVEIAVNNSKIDLADVRGAKVLLAEDNRANQIITKKMCKDWGVSLTVVSNGQEAISSLNNSYDLVLMDIQMPLMDGEEATQRIRKSKNEWNKIPIVAITAHAMKEEQEHFLQIGMNDCLFKPFKEVELMRIISKFKSKEK